MQICDVYGGITRLTFSSVGTLLHNGGRVRPQPFFRTAAYGMWAELSSINKLDTGTKNILKACQLRS